jgi:hypothetical protein
MKTEISCRMTGDGMLQSLLSYFYLLNVLWLAAFLLTLTTESLEYRHTHLCVGSCFACFVLYTGIHALKRIWWCWCVMLLDCIKTVSSDKQNLVIKPWDMEGNKFCLLSVFYFVSCHLLSLSISLYPISTSRHY